MQGHNGREPSVERREPDWFGSRLLTLDSRLRSAEWRNGRRYGLKIRWGETPVRVRLPPRPLLRLRWSIEHGLPLNVPSPEGRGYGSTFLELWKWGEKKSISRSTIGGILSCGGCGEGFVSRLFCDSGGSTFWGIHALGALLLAGVFRRLGAWWQCKNPGVSRQVANAQSQRQAQAGRACPHLFWLLTLDSRPSAIIVYGCLYHGGCRNQEAFSAGGTAPRRHGGHEEEGEEHY